MVKNIRIADMNSYIAAFEPEPVPADTRAALRKSAELPKVEEVKEEIPKVEEVKEEIPKVEEVKEEIPKVEEVKEEIPVEPVKATRKKTTKK